MSNEQLKTVALIGRPNVGKSTLFNRLIGQRKAIETPIAGTTRDRIYGEVFWRGEKFSIIDLAGVETGARSEIQKSMQESVEIAIQKADLIVFVVDWNENNDEADRLIARRLRKIEKRVVLAVNKADNVSRMEEMAEFHRFGNFTVVPVSAITGKNTGDLLDVIVENLASIQKPTEKRAEDKNLVKLAIIGRPNVGKSTLLNSIIGQKRAVVSEEAGTTRDTLDVEFAHKEGKIRIFDTAGLRRKGKIIKDTIESFSVLRTMRAIKNCDVAVLLVDATEGLVAGDVHILGEAKELGKGIILAVNKIDVISGEREEFMGRTLAEYQDKLNFVPWLPVVFISAKEQENVNALLNQVIKVAKNRKKIIPQDDLTAILEDAKQKNFQIQNIKSITQKNSIPPAFLIKYVKEEPHYTQIRYLENKIRDVFPLEGAPIFLDLLSVGRNQRRKRARS